VLREKLEHVVEKGNRGADGRAAGTVEVQAQVDLRFTGFALNTSGSVHILVVAPACRWPGLKLIVPAYNPAGTTA
jgi:hypothetical protein